MKFAIAPGDEVEFAGSESIHGVASFTVPIAYPIAISDICKAAY